MRIKRIIQTGLVALALSAGAVLVTATAASASPTHSTTDTTCHVSCKPDKKVTYTENHGKINCKCKKTQAGKYWVELTFTVSHGKIDPKDDSVTVTDNYGHTAKLYRKGNSSTFAGEVHFLPTYYRGLRVTKGACVNVRTVCKPFVHLTGSLDCNKCKPAKHGMWEVTLTFKVTKGMIDSSDSHLTVYDNAGHKAELTKVAPGVFKGKISFRPTRYSGLRAVEGTCVTVCEKCEVVKKTPPCGCSGKPAKHDAG